MSQYIPFQSLINMSEIIGRFNRQKAHNCSNIKSALQTSSPGYVAMLRCVLTRLGFRRIQFH